MVEINCKGVQCDNCPFQFKNAQYNNDCFLNEFIFFVEKLSLKNEDLIKAKKIMRDLEDKLINEDYGNILLDFNNLKKIMKV